MGALAAGVGEEEIGEEEVEEGEGGYLDGGGDYGHCGLLWWWLLVER